MHLEPWYTIPARKTFSNRIINDMSAEVVNKVKIEMFEARQINITTEMWTSIVNDDYMALTAHFYFHKREENTFKPINKCLEVIPFLEISHTGNAIRVFLVQVLEEWGIKSKTVAVVSDNGTDIISALERYSFNAAHTLQLEIKDGFTDNPRITILIKK